MTRALLPRVDLSRVVMVAAGALIAVRILAPQWRAGFLPSFPDSYSYLEAAAPGPLSGTFWFGARPPGMSIVLWLLDGNATAFVLLQTLVYVTAFVLLADRLLRLVNSRVWGWVLAGSVLLVAAQARFALWNGEILTESLSISIAILALLAWWRFIGESEGLGSAIVLTVLWLSLRDAHLIPVVILSVVLLVAARRTPSVTLRKMVTRGAIVLLTVCAYSFVSSNVSERTQYGLMNNIGLRVLPDAEMTEAFFDAGMPDSQLLRDQAGKDAWAQGGMLYSPDLADFREWVDGEGSQVFVASLVTDSAFWLGHFTESLDNSLSHQFVEYDRFGAVPRLMEPLPVIGGPENNSEALIALVFVAVVWVLMRRARRSGEALLLATMTFITVSELFVGAVGDAIEVQRHLVGPMSRVSITVVVAAAFLASTVSRARNGMVRSPWAGEILCGTAVVLVAAAIVALEFRTQDWDPAFARTIVERVGRFGGTYYENGIWHHGPLDALLYDIALRITTFDTYWFALAFFVVLIAFVVAWSVTVVARRTGSPSWVLPATFVAVTAHLTLSSSDYAGVLYSRNMSTALVAAGFALVVADSPWTDRARSGRWFVVVAVLGGLAAQTMLSSVLAVSVLLVFLIRLRSSDTSLRRPILTAGIAAAGSLLSAALWYWLRGVGSEFWQNWWVMGNHMNRATGLSLIEQFDKGREVLLAYYGERQLLLAVIAVAASLAFIGVKGDTPFRLTVRRFALAWLVAGWLEMIVSQRYSSHYYVVLMVPTAILLASTLAVVTDRFRDRHNESADGDSSPGRARTLAVVAAVAVIFTQGVDLTRAGLEGLGRFRGFEAHAQFVRDTRSGASKNLRAIIDLVSDDRDPLLAWTMFPWTYLEFERVPATRLSWKSFMLGEIYLARSSPDYVLDDTWKWFDEDMNEANPAVYVRPIEIPFVEDTPFAEFVGEKFTKVFVDETFELSLRSDIVGTLLSQSPALEVPKQDVVDGVVETDGACSMLSGVMSSAAPAFTVTFSSLDGSSREWSLALNGGIVRSFAGTNEIYAKDVATALGTDVRIVTGVRSSVLLIGGQIAGAVSHGSPVRAQLTWDPTVTTIDRLVSERTLLPSGC